MEAKDITKEDMQNMLNCASSQNLEDFKNNYRMLTAKFGMPHDYEIPDDVAAKLFDQTKNGVLDLILQAKEEGIWIKATQ